MRICVYGAASPTIDDNYKEVTFNLGKLMVKRGHSLVFGGGGNGLMGAVAQGVKSENGHIIGVIPKFFDNENIEAICDYCDQLIEPDTMRERKQIMEDTADAFIVVPGGIGTYEEFFEMLTLKQLGRHNKPMVMLNTRGYYDPMAAMLQNTVDEGFMSADCLELYGVCNSPEEALDYILNAKLVTGSIERKIEDYNK